MSTHMNKMLAVAAVISVGLFAGSACAACLPPAEQQLEAVQAAMGRAAKAHDVDAFMAAFLHDPSLVFVIDGRVIRGWDALRAQQSIWWRNGKSDVVYTRQGKPACTRLEPGIVVTTDKMASRRTLPDGKVSTGTFAITSIWKKLPQGWRIIYGHESWARPSG